MFHYIEQFQEHRLLGKCPGKSAVVESCINELKPQVWAFMLWKNAKFKAQSEVPPSSWSVYQLWCNLAPEHKEAWIAAGKSIQSFTKISHAKVQEVRTKVQVCVISTSKVACYKNSKIKTFWLYYVECRLYTVRL